MTKYLDENGLAYFWTKIKAWLSSHAPVKYFGQNWNVDTNDDYALVVGNGADGNNPKDVFMIEHDGDLVIGGEDSSKSVSFRGENTTETMIKFESNSDNNDGNGLALGAAGRMVIGSGGAKDWFLNQLLAGQIPDDPRLYLGSAHNVHLFTNYDDPNNTGHFEFSEYKNFIIYNGGWIKQYADKLGTEHIQSNELLSSHSVYSKDDKLLGYSDVIRKETNDPNGEGVYRSFIVQHPTTQQTCGLYFHVNDDGTRLFEVSGGSSGQTSFRNALGANNGIWPISLGGTGQSNSVWTDDINSVITAASGITIQNVSVGKWGKLIGARINWKKNSSISVGANGDTSNFNIGNLKSGYRPYVSKGLLGFGDYSDQRPYYYVNDQGTIQVLGFESKGTAYTIPANTVLVMYIVYLGE